MKSFLPLEGTTNAKKNRGNVLVLGNIKMECAKRGKTDTIPARPKPGQSGWVSLSWSAYQCHCPKSSSNKG